MLSFMNSFEHTGHFSRNGDQNRPEKHAGRVTVGRKEKMVNGHKLICVAFRRHNMIFYHAALAYNDIPQIRHLEYVSNEFISSEIRRSNPFSDSQLLGNWGQWTDWSDCCNDTMVRDRDCIPHKIYYIKPYNLLRVSCCDCDHQVQPCRKYQEFHFIIYYILLCLIRTAVCGSDRTRAFRYNKQGQVN